MAGVSSLSKMCQEATLCLFRVRVQWKMVTEDIISIRHRRGGAWGVFKFIIRKVFRPLFPLEANT